MSSSDDSSDYESDRQKKPRNNSLASEDKQKRRKAKLEALTYSGCGYGRAKKRLVTSFWEAMWPKLENGGWTKVITILEGADFHLLQS